MSLSPAIELTDVVFKRGNRAIMNGLNLHIESQKLTAIMGPSGVGKTTLLKLITGQEKPLSGTIRVFGENVNKMTHKQLYAMRQRIGVLFQSGALLTDLTVFDNIALPLRENTKLHEQAIKDIVTIKLESVGLRGAKDLYPRELSGGMARRVSMARSLALDPDIIMYDEPFVGQDPITLAVLVKLIDHVSNSLPITSLTISHDVNEILSIADYGFLLSGGIAVGHGTPKQLQEEPSEYIQQFLNGVEDGPVPFHFPCSTTLAEELNHPDQI